MLFLNGVCRHELIYLPFIVSKMFLNGVCRHEPLPVKCKTPMTFLNGVCRHEQESTQRRNSFVFSKWRMSP